MFINYFTAQELATELFKQLLQIYKYINKIISPLKQLIKEKNNMSIICYKKRSSILASTYVAAKINTLQPCCFGITAFEFNS